MVAESLVGLFIKITEPTNAVLVQLLQGTEQEAPQLVQLVHIKVYVLSQPTARLSGDAKHWADSGSGQEKLEGVSYRMPTEAVIALGVPVQTPNRECEH